MGGNWLYTKNTKVFAVFRRFSPFYAIKHPPNPFKLTCIWIFFNHCHSKIGSMRKNGYDINDFKVN